ncbi:hypothetical protein [Methylomonas albis]|uniref:Peptidase M41 domain-containing protein n=1 Tax=Methylomonas albis TaxID=1854563 RepID=A0ABR9D8B5_9GAMM|nr:hypothetical protein [Methylomonas albis]MBD9358494.1 hypothetical protein [Methylomonas albis]CAD6881907.1 hypothetical protein [Methylomonas albis]
MERNYYSTTSTFVHPSELNWRTAFHEAGHAAAIHLGNRQKQLPPVFFEIHVKRPSNAYDDFFAKVIDGNLIQNLPIAVVESFNELSDDNQQHACQRAYEADVINLLVGPLAEAKYVSIRDDEVFNINLINFKALHNYGGYSDLEKVLSYLDHFIASKNQREEKMQELLSQAFRFIDNRRHWKCILNLAHYILDSQQEIISCDEAIGIFDSCLTANTPFRSARYPFLFG